MPQGLQIGRLSRETGMSIDTIRFYERQGLLQKALRSEGGFRLFDLNAMRDLKFIRGAQRLGFSLEEVHELLVLRRNHSRGCSHVHDLLHSKLSLIEEKIRELQALGAEIRSALGKCEQDSRCSGRLSEKTCPVLSELDKMRHPRIASQGKRLQMGGPITQ